MRKIRAFLARLMIIVITMASFYAEPVSADDVGTEALSEWDNFEWSLEAGVLTVSGNGDLPNETVKA